DFESYIALIQPTQPLPQDPSFSKANIFATYVNNPAAVKTQGWALGLDYLIHSWALSGNVSFNSIKGGDTAGLQNDFNSPKYRVNIGFSNRNIYKNVGFNIMWRWQDHFFWNSSFSTGNVPAYSTIDAQVNYKLPRVKTMIKLGGSNILNHYYQTSFGNPKIGAIYYVSLLFDELLK
ncbi:MAG TPA: TonB-dependent receptor, partial [Puia sp.]|nr:TonB-dependent receptor [Puia sp.]